MWKKYFKIGMILLIDLSNKMNCYYYIKHRYFLECKMGSPIFDSFFITNNFNPNNLNLSPLENRFNSATQGVFEMGSTFKPITKAIGYDSDTINEYNKYLLITLSQIYIQAYLKYKLIHPKKSQKEYLNILW